MQLSTLLLSAFILFCFAPRHTSQQRRHSGNTPEERKAGALHNIAFDLPDITKVLSSDFAGGEHQLEAFKSISNDRILHKNARHQFRKLVWVSIGSPRLLETQDRRNKTLKRIFNRRNLGYTIYIETLTPALRRILADTVWSKYNITIDPSFQVVHLVLSQFSCSIKLFDLANGGKTYVVRGDVLHFRSFPLRMDFWAPVGSKEQQMMEEQLERMANNPNEDLILHCYLASMGQEIRTNTFTITKTVGAKLKLREKLFGDGRSKKESVYVTREQIIGLSEELYSSLNIDEDFQISEHQFTESFIQEFIRQVSDQQFRKVSLNETLGSLSRYGLDFSKDIKPDVIRRELSRLLKVDSFRNKTYIKLSNEAEAKLKTDDKLSDRYELGLEFISLNAVAEFVKNKAKEWANSSKSLKEQLRELNKNGSSDINWEIEGEMVIPKSLNVAKLSAGKFEKTLVFQRVRRQYSDASFQRKFALYTRGAQVIEDPTQVFEAQLGENTKLNRQILEKVTRLSSEMKSVKVKSFQTEILPPTPRMLAMRGKTVPDYESHGSVEMTQLDGCHTLSWPVTPQPMSHWTRITLRRRGAMLSRPFLLPASLNGWMVNLIVKWHHSSRRLQIYPVLFPSEYNSAVAKKLPVSFELTVRLIHPVSGEVVGKTRGSVTLRDIDMAPQRKLILHGDDNLSPETLPEFFIQVAAPSDLK